MTREDFDKLTPVSRVQPNYPEYVNSGYRILTIDRREGLVEINEHRMFSKNNVVQI